MKYVFEFIGTFFLVLTIGMAVIGPQGAGALAPLAIAAALTAMIYAGGHVSGAHYNPAVSFGVFLRGKLSMKDMFVYWLAQIMGAVLAAFVVIFFKGGVGEVAAQVDLAKIVAGEFLFTFALVLVVLQVATSKRTAGNSYFGLAIGLVIVTGAYSVGPISGGAFNPAVSVAAVVLNLMDVKILWVYVVGQLVAAGLSALVFRLNEPAEMNR